MRSDLPHHVLRLRWSWWHPRKNTVLYESQSSPCPQKSLRSTESRQLAGLSSYLSSSLLHFKKDRAAPFLEPRGWGLVTCRGHTASVWQPPDPGRAHSLTSPTLSLTFHLRPKAHNPWLRTSTETLKFQRVSWDQWWHQRNWLYCVSSSA
jgi:hypothetical protein